MNKTLKFLLVIGMLLLYLWLGYTVNYYQELRELNSNLIEKLLAQNVVCRNQLTECEIRLNECQKFNVFQHAVSEIGARQYSKSYDCYDHSKDLQKKLRELDIESNIFINDGNPHIWLGVWIEAVSGEFINPNNNLKILRTN